MPALPFVTIAMPCLNEEVYIEACIRSVAAQDYPAARMEILVADGGSSDRTLEILANLAREDPRIAVIHNPQKIQAAGLNEIIRRARGEVIVRMDVHCEYARDYVSRCIEALARSGAENAGGAQRARARSRFQQALCAALASKLGTGKAGYRSADAEGFVDTVFLGAFRRRVFETVGMYDPKAITNEDAELNQRILAAGGRVYLSRDIVVHYFPRDSLPALFHQYYKYGRGRARTLLKLGNLTSVRSFVPFLMVSSGAVLLITSPFQPFTPYVAGAYAALTLTEAVRVGAPVGLAAIPLVWGIFPTMHIAHGVGFAAGLVQFLLRPDWEAPEILEAEQAVPASERAAA